MVKTRMDARLFNQTHHLRASVLCGLSLLLTIVALFFTIFNIFYTHSYELATLEFIFMCYSTYVYSKAKQSSHSLAHIYLYVYFLILIIGVGTFVQPIANGLVFGQASSLFYFIC